MTPTLDGTLGIDFGTSNSAMAWADAGCQARLIPLEGDAPALPTALFYNAEDHCTHFGRDAVAQYLAGTEGRLMRSLKSLLGSSLLQEDRRQRPGVSFRDIIAQFLAMLRERATQALGAAPRRVVLGRPVHFVDDDPARDAAAQQSLLRAALAVGFEEVSFQLEPIAAALDYERRLARESLVLVVDIGGGTSDFTVVRLGPDRMGAADRSGDILATTGVHIGGTDFDHKLSLEHAMPLLGYRHLGPQQREVPSRVFFDLSTWHLIHWLYQPRAISQAQSPAQQLFRPAPAPAPDDGAGPAPRPPHRLRAGAGQDPLLAAGSGHRGRPVLCRAGPGHDHGNRRPARPPGRPAGAHRGLRARLRAARRPGRRRARRDLPHRRLVGAAAVPAGAAGRVPGVPLVEGDLFGGVASGLAYSRG